MKLTTEQVTQLLKPLNASRVAKRQQAGMSLSYLEAWDVRAHLIRIFGFGGWSAEVETAELAFEEQDSKGRWNVGYRVLMRLHIHPHGERYDGPHYVEAAVGSATLPSRGEAHDMAIKTAESDALKRAAINLGTQFGLSLYDSGNLKDVVGRTLVGSEGIVTPEITPPPPGLVAEISEAADEKTLKAIWDTCAANDWLDQIPEGSDLTMKQHVNARLTEMRETP